VSETHELGLARFLTQRHAARWLAAKRPPDDLPHFEPRLDPAAAELLGNKGMMHDEHVAFVLARLRAEGAPEECVLFTEGEWGEPAPLGSAIPDLMWTGAGFASCVAGRLALYVREDGSGVYLLRRA
jgi:hypothetical protein